MLVSHCYINKEYVVFLYGYSRFLSDHHYKTEILLRDILNTILILLFNLRCIVSCSNVQLVPLPSFSTFTNLTLSLIPRSDDSVQLLHSPSSQSLLTVVSWNEKKIFHWNVVTRSRLKCAGILHDFAQTDSMLIFINYLKLH